MMKHSKLKIILMTVCLLLASASAAFASDEIDGYQVRQLNKQEEEIVLREMSLDKAKLTEEERIALLTKGTAVVLFSQEVADDVLTKAVEDKDYKVVDII